MGLQNISKLRKSNLINSTNIFVAKVVNNNDPLKLQRVQFRIQKIHRDVKDVDLPWASPLSKSVQGNNQIGSLYIPVNGSTIIVEYIDDYSIFYRGDFISSQSSNSELVQNYYTKCYGFIDASGNKFFINTELDTVSFTHLSGTQIDIAQNGSISIKSANDTNIEAKNINLKATTAINIDCQQLNVKSQTSAFSASTSLNLNTASCALKSSGACIIEGSTVTFNSSGVVAVNASSFTLNSGFNLVPISGWVTPPAPNAVAPSPTISPPTAPTTPTARTKPTIPGFSNQTNY